MKSLGTKSRVILSRLLIGAVLVMTPPYSVSSSQPTTATPAGASLTGQSLFDAKVSFIQAAYVVVTFEILKQTGIYDLVETNNSVETSYTEQRKLALKIKGMDDEMSVMTCNIESGAHNAQKSEKNMDCSGSSKTAAHTFMGQQRFESEVEVSHDVLAHLQSEPNHHIAIDVTYI